MATNYPGSLDSYSTKAAGNTIAEGHINDPQDAIKAIEQKLGTGTPSSASTNTALVGTGNSTTGYSVISLANTSLMSGILTIANGGTPFVAGDWIVSSVTTARSGWTNVSATYSNKFIRINATPLTTGGADAHTTPSHTLTTAEIPAHTHTGQGIISGGETGTGWGVSNNTEQNTGSTGGGGGHAHTAADNVPAYVQTVIFQKD